MYGAASNFLALNKLRGFTARQARLLELEAVYLGTQYAGLPPWEQEIGPKVDAAGNQTIGILCGHEREPRLKAGVIEEKVGKLVRLLVGEGRFPALKISGAGQATVEEALAQSVKLPTASRGPTRDVIVKGSGPLGFTLLADGRPEALQLRPEWCEPIFVAKVGRPRAAELAAELAQIPGLALSAPRSDREYLWTPEGAASADLAMLRYEYVFHEEEAERDGGGREVCWRHRVDYLPTATVYYVDVQVYADDDTAVTWEVDYIDSHGWGIVPVAWARSLDAEDGEPEGPSLITESLRSISEAADRMLTRKDASVAVIASPKPYTIDLQDMVADVNADMGKPTGWRDSSGEVLMFQARSGSSAAKIGLLEPTGKGPEVAKAHLDDLLAHAQRISGVIAHDPQTAAGVQSGVALERMMEPTIALVNDYRVAIGEMLATFVRKLAVALGAGDVTVEVQWPPVIALTAADQAAVADALLKATGGSAVLSQQTATRIAAHAFDVEDPQAEVEAVSAGADQAMAAARAALAARPVVPPVTPPAGG